MCAQSTSGRVPTRLIDISGSTPRIRLSEQLVGPISYVTLSHCWGKSHKLTLQRNNLHAFQDKIPDEALPKTFEDAIFIARYLGFGYLWIDSLCIIQDDEDDWKRESVLMTSVYGGGVLNIAATSAEDSALAVSSGETRRGELRSRFLRGMGALSMTVFHQGYGIHLTSL